LNRFNLSFELDIARRPYLAVIIIQEWSHVSHLNSNILYMTFKLQFMIHYNAKVFDFGNIW